MDAMNDTSLILLSDRRERGRRLVQAIDVRRSLVEAGREARTERQRRGRRGGGRAWVNGAQVGDAD